MPNRGRTTPGGGLGQRRSISLDRGQQMNKIGTAHSSSPRVEAQSPCVAEWDGRANDLPSNNYMHFLFWGVNCLKIPITILIPSQIDSLEL